eukprot:EG_transcript_3064
MGPEAAPAFSAVYAVAAVLTCLSGSHSALLLADASVTLESPWLMVLSGLQFVVQSIFSLHFIAMCGMDFGMEWGFDIGLTLVSLACVVLFGTAAITLALWLRHRLQPHIKAEFGDQLVSPSLWHYPRLLAFIVVRVPLLRLLLAVVLMVVGAAGCHHVGMWSIHGQAHGHLACQLTYWSFLTTVALGGAVCVVAILTFLVVPQGVAAAVAAGLLAAGIAAFHFCSAMWGMRYLVGVEGVTTQLIMGSEAIIMFILAQGALSQIIIALFTRMTLADHAANLKQLAMAQTLGQYIRDMDLKPAQALQLETPNPSELEQTLFGIVDNLLQYRPYLPDTLFPPRAGAVDLTLDASDAGSTLQRTLSGLSLPERHRSTVSGGSDRQASGVRAGQRPRSATARGRRAVNNMALGLRPSQLTVLRIRLQGSVCGTGKAADVERVEERLTRFMALATAQVKANGGTIVTCASGAVVAMWATVSPEAALDTALALQQLSDASLVQVVQSGAFLSGNLAADSMRAFNVVGPLDWPGQQLLRLGGCEQFVFVTTHEWHQVKYKYRCLPFEQVLMNGDPVTVYAVLAATAGPPEASNEWMYEVEKRAQQFDLAGVERCWQAYLRGAYQEVRDEALVLSSNAVPLWYPQHLVSLAQLAAERRTKQPTKSLEALGWPSPATPGLGTAVDDVILIQDF